MPATPLGHSKRRKALANHNVVALAFLTQQELEQLGTGFRTYLPVREDDVFDGLLAKLDQVEAAPLGRGVTLMPLQSTRRIDQ